MPKQDRKLFFKIIPKILKKKLPGIIFVASAAAALTCPAVAAPAVLAAGLIAAGTVGYVQYKKENPKASVLHFAKNAAKNTRNQFQHSVQNCDVCQSFMRVREKLGKTKSVGLIVADGVAKVSGVDNTTNKQNDDQKVFTEKADTARRLNHINTIKAIDEAKREL